MVFSLKICSQNVLSFTVNAKEKHLDKWYYIWYYQANLSKPKGGGNIKVQLKSQPRKYLDSVDEHTRKKLLKALKGLRELKGDIVKLKGYPNRYRLKIHHYRILFSIDDDGIVQIIMVDTINTRTNIKY